MIIRKLVELGGPEKGLVTNGEPVWWKDSVQLINIHSAVRTLQKKTFFVCYSRPDDSDEEEVPTSSKKKSKTELNLLKKRLKSIMKKVIEHSDE